MYNFISSNFAINVKMATVIAGSGEQGAGSKGKKRREPKKSRVDERSEVDPENSGSLCQRYCLDDIIRRLMAPNTQGRVTVINRYST